MKEKKMDRLFIAIEKDFKENAKVAASKTGKTLSELIRDYLRQLIKSQNKIK